MKLEIIKYLIKEIEKEKELIELVKADIAQAEEKATAEKKKLVKNTYHHGSI